MTSLHRAPGPTYAIWLPGSTSTCATRTAVCTSAALCASTTIAGAPRYAGRCCSYGSSPGTCTAPGSARRRVCRACPAPVSAFLSSVGVVIAALLTCPLTDETAAARETHRHLDGTCATRVSARRSRGRTTSGVLSRRAGTTWGYRRRQSNLERHVSCRHRCVPSGHTEVRRTCGAVG